MMTSEEIEQEPGYELTVTVYGADIDDLVLGLEEVKDAVAGGCTMGVDGNASGSYNFQRTGEARASADRGEHAEAA